MKNKILYYIKNNYGVATKYPAIPTQQRALAKITKRVTIDNQIIQGLEELGLEFEEITESQAKQIQVSLSPDGVSQAI